MGSNRGWNRVAALLLSVTAWSDAAGASEPLPAPSVDNVRLANNIHKHVVRRVVASAARRLEDKDCESVVDEFTAKDGRSIRATLAERDLTASDALKAIYFYDGMSHRACGRGAFAFTSPGNRLVFLCSTRFFRASLEQPVVADIMLIHELLHVLGLAENPPTSGQITERVFARCSLAR
jgi:hypothetical protein